MLAPEDIYRTASDIVPFENGATVFSRSIARFS